MIRWKFLAVLLFATFPAAHAAAQMPPDSPDGPVISGRAALRIALDHVREEAIEFRRTGALTRDTISFADTFEYAIDPRDALRIVVSRQDRSDPVVDSYIRWQFIGFAPDLALIENDDRLRLGRELPELIRNPLMDPARHRTLERHAARAGRNAADRDEAQRLWEQWRIEADAANLLNQPSLKFRERIIASAPADGPDRIILRLRDLEDLIEAGWDTRAAKGRITRELKERKLDESISLTDRWKLIKLVESLEGLESKALRDVTIFAREPARVSYSTLAVRGSDVKKWSAYLNRHDP